MRLCSVCGSRKVYNGKFWSCPNWNMHRKGGDFTVTTDSIEVPDYTRVTLSKEQQSASDAVLDALSARSAGQAHPTAVLTTARAGTGKTTLAMKTLYEVGKRFPNIRAGYCAFNRRAADEARVKIPFGEANTLHSLLGLATIRYTLGKKLSIDNDKEDKLIEEVFIDPRRKERPWYKKRSQTEQNVLELAQHVMADAGNGHPDHVREVALRLGMSPDHLSAEEINGVAKLIHLSMKMLVDRRWVSPNDMINAPILVRDMWIRVPRYDLLIVDEFQDLTLAQQTLALLAVGHVTEDVGVKLQSHADPGIILAIGDDKQAIYAWRGAMADGMSRFAETCELFNGVEHRTVRQTRRCPKRVVELVHPIVPDYEALDGAIEGTVGIVDYQFVLDHIGNGRSDTMIIGRTTAPLVKVAFKLVKKKIPVRFISKNMNEEISKVTRVLIWRFERSKDHKPSIQEFMVLVSNRIDNLLDKMGDPANKRSKIWLEQEIDKLEVILAIAEESVTWDDYWSSLPDLFATRLRPEQYERAPIFSTIHSIKGSEADYVIIADPEKMPHTMATLPWQIDQELNLIYVACTRALKALYFIGSLPTSLEAKQHLIEYLV